jgi:ABC-type arginine transport system permease subunit
VFENALSPGVEKLYMYILLLLPTPIEILLPPPVNLWKVIILSLSVTPLIAVALNQQEILIGLLV